MEEQTKHMNNELREAFQKLKKPVPGSDFTANVMNSIEEEAPVSQIAYTPLFNRTVWTVLAAIVIVLLVLTIWMGSSTDSVFSGFLSEMNQGQLMNVFSTINGKIIRILSSSVIMLSLIAVLAAGMINMLIFQRIDQAG